MPEGEAQLTPYVERDLCIGAAYCVKVAPATFALDEQEIAIVTDPAASGRDELNEAAELCPAGAVYLHGPPSGRA